MGKTDNLTIRVDPDLKKKAELIRSKYFKRLPMNIFLELMIEYGMDVQEGIGEYERRLYSQAVSEKVGKRMDEKNAAETLEIMDKNRRTDADLARMAEMAAGIVDPPPSESK